MREGAQNNKSISELLEKTNSIRLLFGFLALVICLLALIFMPYDTFVKALILLFSFNLVFQTLFDHWATVFISLEKFEYRIMFNIIPQMFNFLCAFLIFIVEWKVLTLLVIQLLISFINMIACFFIARRLSFFRLNLNWEAIKAINVYLKYLKEGFYFLIISLAGLLFAKIDVLMLTLIGTLDDVATYNVAFRNPGMPSKSELLFWQASSPSNKKSSKRPN